MVNDPWFSEKLARVQKIPLGAERNAVLKELSIMVIDDVYRLITCAPYLMTYNWTWVKNFFGETEVGYINTAPMVSRLWIDQGLKADMGF